MPACLVSTAGDAPHERLLKVERRGFKCSGFRVLEFRVQGFGVWVRV